jgi:ferric-dicitrate binding protein FerR (iron transport regulator)
MQLDLPESYARIEGGLAQKVSTEKNMEASVPPVHRVHFLRRGFFKYAAAIIILFGIGAYLYFNKKKPQEALVKQDQALPADISPGGNKAVLTLSDGSTITLDSAANGVLAQQGNASVVKTSSGEIRYDAKGAATTSVMMNTMTTPRGGQYQLTLPDGSRVWLNAASSITYPAFFVGNERKVKITGEAYLEVAHNRAKPFIVDIDGKSTVQVLGTSFNINSYADDGNIKTTLVEGSVKMSNTSADAVVLKPGQQGVQPSNGKGITVASAVDVAQVLAWKNGIFDFSGKRFESLMNDVERWYDIDVKYEGAVPNFKVTGQMDRGVKLSGVLRFMEGFGLQVQLEGRTLIVKSK